MAITAFTDIAGLVAVYNAKNAGSVTKTGNNVSAVASEAGSGGAGWNLSVFGAGAEVLHAVDTVNGHDVFTFQGGKALESSANTALTTQTVVIYCAYDATGVSEFASDGVDLADSLAIFQNSSNGYRASAGTNFTHTDTVDTGFHCHVVACSVAGTSSEYSIDNTFITAGDVGSKKITGITLGSRYGSPNPVFPMNGKIAVVAVYDGFLTTAQMTDLDDYVRNDLFALANDVLFTTEPDDDRVYQRINGSRTISLAGTYTGTPTAIECRTVEAGTSTEHTPWTVVDGSPSGGTWSGTLEVTEHSTLLNVEARHADDPAKNVTGANTFGVGVVVAMWGQSNADNMFVTGTDLTPSAAMRVYQGANRGGGTGWEAGTTTGNGVNQLGSTLTAELGVAVGIVRSSSSGVGLYFKNGNGHWAPTPHSLPALRTPHTDAMTDAAAIGREIEALVWTQVHTDATNNVDAQEYYDALVELMDEVRNDLTNFYTNRSQLSSLPIFISLNTPNTEGTRTDVQWQRIRTAKLKFLNDVANTHLAAELMDLSLQDNIHLNAASQTEHGERVGASIANVIGGKAYGRGPSIRKIDDSNEGYTDVQLTHRGGTDFTPTTGITGFKLFEVGTDEEITITSAVRQDASTIRLSHADNNQLKYITYLYGVTPTSTSAVYDNTSEVLPLEAADYTATAAGGGSGFTEFISEEFIS